MGYLKAQDKMILTPPKNGTTTIDWIMDQMQSPPMVRGHVHSDLAVKKLGHVPQFAMHVRHPLDRFISIANVFYAEPNPDKLWAVFTTTVNRQIWTFPQAWFIRHDVKLFPFEGFPILEWIGWKGEVPRLNAKKRGHWNKTNIGPLVPRIEEYFADDYELWRKANHGERTN